jgi:hypothetical protein
LRHDGAVVLFGYDAVVGHIFILRVVRFRVFSPYFQCCRFAQNLTKYNLKSFKGFPDFI